MASPSGHTGEAFNIRPLGLKKLQSSIETPNNLTVFCRLAKFSARMKRSVACGALTDVVQGIQDTALPLLGSLCSLPCSPLSLFSLQLWLSPVSLSPTWWESSQWSVEGWAFVFLNGLLEDPLRKRGRLLPSLFPQESRGCLAPSFPGSPWITPPTPTPQTVGAHQLTTGLLQFRSAMLVCQTKICLYCILRNRNICSETISVLKEPKSPAWHNWGSPPPLF